MSKDLGYAMQMLYQQLDNINRDDLTGVALDEAIEKGKMSVVIVKTAVDVGRLALDALKAKGDLVEAVSIPKSLLLDSKNG